MKSLTAEIHFASSAFRIVSYIILFILSIYTGYAIVTSNNYFLLLIIGGLLSLIVFYNSRIAIYIILVSVSFFEILYAHTPFPRQLTWLPEIMIGILTIKVLYILSCRKFTVRTGDVKSFRFLFLLFILLIFIGIFSGLSRGFSPVITLLGFRNYFKYILLFFLLYYLDFDRDFYKRIVALIFVIAAIQVPVSVLEYAIFRAPDWAGGTFGYHATGAMAIFVASIISLVIGVSNFYKISLKYWILSVLLFIPLTVGAARVGFFFIPLIAVFHLFQKKKDMKTHLIYLILVILAIPLYNLLLHFASHFIKSDILMYVKDPQLILLTQSGYKESVGKIGRLSSIPYVFNVIKKDFFTLLFGVGPGNASPSFFGSFPGKYAGLPFWPTSLVRLILEYGILGAMLYLSMFVYIYFRIGKIVNSIKDSYWRGIIIGFKGIVLLYLIATAYAAIFFTDILSFMFWSMAAAIFVTFKSHKETNAIQSIKSR